MAFHALHTLSFPWPIRADVYKFALPLRDMKVVNEGVTVAVGLALGSWNAFKKM
jgi:hypothetical protein